MAHDFGLPCVCAWPLQPAPQSCDPGNYYYWGGEEKMGAGGVTYMPFLFPYT